MLDCDPLKDINRRCSFVIGCYPSCGTLRTLTGIQYLEKKPNEQRIGSWSDATTTP